MPMPKSFVPDPMPKSFVPDDVCCMCSAIVPATASVVHLTYKGQRREYCVPCFDALRTRFADMLTARIGLDAARRIVRTLPSPIPAQP
jgi:hypothetical protein